MFILGPQLLILMFSPPSLTIVSFFYIGCPILSNDFLVTHNVTHLSHPQPLDMYPGPPVPYPFHVHHNHPIIRGVFFSFSSLACPPQIYPTHIIPPCFDTHILQFLSSGWASLTSLNGGTISLPKKQSTPNSALDSSALQETLQFSRLCV